jgi:hypothetical protein
MKKSRNPKRVRGIIGITGCISDAAATILQSFNLLPRRPRSLMKYSTSIYIYIIPYKPPRGRVAGGVKTPPMFANT